MNDVQNDDRNTTNSGNTGEGNDGNSENGGEGRDENHNNASRNAGGAYSNKNCYPVTS